MYESGGPWSTLGCVVDSWRVNVSLLCIYWLLEDWCVPQLAEAIPENEASTTIRKITAISGSTWGGLFYNLNWQILSCNWNTATSPNNVRLRLNDCLYLLLLPDKRMCHTSKKRGLHSTFWPPKMLQNLPNFYGKVFFIFHLEQLWVLPYKCPGLCDILQKREVCAHLFDPPKCFKICHIYGKRKPM